ncbi:MAG: hypothetical protein HUJ22_10290 [Gracilimonas sp.]|uniref:hypothetical protein n=1 Tax=Gracilimonas sp. TaxID=1974203 RepID=UPI001990C2F1|nr:hypothetical protein [Gracilimonas sp.]MBD3616950.1 hypothetical protein [Gracilimonas sp.]
MRNRLLKTCVLLIFMHATFVVISCTTGPNTDDFLLKGSWNQEGLQHAEINVIKEDEEGILFGTDSGLLQWDEYAKEFYSLGLSDEQVIGVVKFNDGVFLVGTKASGFSSGDTTLFRLGHGATNWDPFMNNFGGETGEYTFISKGPLKRQNTSGTVWVRAGNAVARSDDKGNKWELISGNWGSWGGAAVLFYLDPFHQDNVWVGGVSALSQANLYNTTDRGSTWTDVSAGLSDDIEAVAYDVISYPNNSNIILTGLSGSVPEAFKIKKSTDMGKNWKTVNHEVGIHCFTHSAANSEIVYASGRNSEGRLFFLASGDFGDTWQTIDHPESPTGIRVNDMVSVMEAGEEVLYLGTNKGVYSFIFDK